MASRARLARYLSSVPWPTTIWACGTPTGYCSFDACTYRERVAAPGLLNHAEELGTVELAAQGAECASPRVSTDSWQPDALHGVAESQIRSHFNPYMTLRYQHEVNRPHGSSAHNVDGEAVCFGRQPLWTGQARRAGALVSGGAAAG